MVPNIRKTSDLVQEITAASEEQSSGVGQINAAIGQLSETAQQNASSSEELAATAEEMSGQAEQLRQLMSFFKGSEKERVARGTGGRIPVAATGAAARKQTGMRLARGAAPATEAVLDETQFSRF
jgi:methyl-accepting chemotaxis protein